MQLRVVSTLLYANPELQSPTWRTREKCYYILLVVQLNDT